MALFMEIAEWTETYILHLVHCNVAVVTAGLGEVEAESHINKDPES